MAANPFRSDWLRAAAQRRARCGRRAACRTCRADRRAAEASSRSPQQLDKTRRRATARATRRSSRRGRAPVVARPEAARRRARRRPARAGLAPRRPRRHLGAEPHRMAASRSSAPRASALILVNINPAYRSAELEYALNKVGCRALIMARALQVERLPRRCCSARAGDRLRRERRPLDSRAPADAASTWSCSATEPRAAGHAVASPSLRALGGPAHRSAARRAQRGARPRRRDQHPVHQRHHRRAQGRDAVALQHRQQRALLRQGDGASPSTTGCASRCRCTTASAWCSACSPARRPARRWCSRARASTPATTLQRGRSSTAAPRCTACRRCSSPMLEHPSFAQLRPLVAAHRHHGRRALPDRDDASAWSREMHMSEVTIAYGMTETSADLVPVARSTIRSSAASRPSAASSRISR